jgi:ribosome maturation factor RimP
MSEKGVVSKVYRLAELTAQNLGLNIWDIRFLKEGTSWVLRVYIDKDGGVDINDCENMSRALDKPLDELDPISHSYSLEVSSPGLERELTRDEHFQKYIGQNVKILLVRPDENKKRKYSGKLISYKNNLIELAEDNNCKPFTINKKDTVYVKLDDIDF